MNQNMAEASNQSGQKPSLAEAARQLVASSNRGILSTLIAGEGHPYGSLIDFAPMQGGDVLLFISSLAEHQRYLVADPRASIFIGPDIMEEDALAKPRVTLVGQIQPVENRNASTDLYLRHHPEAERFINFSDFSFYRLHVQKVRYIAGFGRMGWIPGDRYRDEM